MNMLNKLNKFILLLAIIVIFLVSFIRPGGFINKYLPFSQRTQNPDNSFQKTPLNGIGLPKIQTSKSSKEKKVQLLAGGTKEKRGQTKSNAASVTQKIEMVISIPYLLSEVREKGYTQSLAARKDRMNEYMISLKKSLTNKYISKIHILYTLSGLKNYIINKTHDLSKNIRQKLQFHQVENDVLANVALEFAYKNLQDRIVMINQADCYPHSGLDLIDKDKMLKHNVMYALSRHGQPEKRCNMSKSFNSVTCQWRPYGGSHDTYIFIPRGPLPQEAMKTLNHSNHYVGIDNVLVFTFQKILKFKVLNSCKVIVMNHLHCVSWVRNSARVRINNRSNSGYAAPTYKLVP